MSDFAWGLWLETPTNGAFLGGLGAKAELARPIKTFFKKECCGRLPFASSYPFGRSRTLAVFSPRIPHMVPEVLNLGVG